MNLVLRSNLANHRGIAILQNLSVQKSAAEIHSHLLPMGNPIISLVGYPSPCHLVGYPLVNIHKKILKMAIEIVDFPMKNGGSFHSKMLVHQRVLHPAIFLLHVSGGIESNKKTPVGIRESIFVQVHMPSETLGDGVRESYKLWHMTIIWKSPIVGAIPKNPPFVSTPSIPCCLCCVVGGFQHLSSTRESTRLRSIPIWESLSHSIPSWNPEMPPRPIPIHC